MYTVIGYDKDNDFYVEYGDYYDFDSANNRMEELMLYLAHDELRTEYGEPIDWLEIYQITDNGEELVAKSYK